MIPLPKLLLTFVSPSPPSHLPPRRWVVNRVVRATRSPLRAAAACLPASPLKLSFSASPTKGGAAAASAHAEESATAFDPVFVQRFSELPTHLVGLVS